MSYEGKDGIVPYRVITKIAPLSMALWICAGEDPLDISDHHGVELDEPMRSVWIVVDAIHATPQSDIKFPQTHIKQLNVANATNPCPCCCNWSLEQTELIWRGHEWELILSKVAKSSLNN